MEMQKDEKAVLIRGGGSTLGPALVRVLAERGCSHVAFAPVYEKNGSNSEMAAGKMERILDEYECSDFVVTIDNGEEIVSRAVDELGGIDYYFDLFVPHPESTSEEVMQHASTVLERGAAAGSAIAEHAEEGCIVNHCFLPSMYADTALGPHFPMLRGAVTGATRSLGVRFGEEGVRVNCVQTGLVDLPETQALASERVKDISVPIGRWTTPEEVANLMNFLVQQGTYVTGQTVVIDGGLTAGYTGT